MYPGLYGDNKTETCQLVQRHFGAGRNPVYFQKKP